MASVTFPTNLGGNGLTYTDEEMLNGGHETRFVTMLKQETIMAQSASSNAVSALDSKNSASASAASASASATSAATSAATALSVAAQDLTAINKTIAGTAVAGFVYDTRNDSDGGRTMRNAGYPASFSVVATATTVTLYKNTDTALTQIGQITGLSGVTSAFALNGWLFVGSSSGVGKYNLLNSLTLRKQYSTSSAPAIVGNSVNKIVGVILTSATIDAATGLPAPTVYVATLSGLSRIAEDDTISSWTETLISANYVLSMDVFGDALFFSLDLNVQQKVIHRVALTSLLSSWAWTNAGYYCVHFGTVWGTGRVVNWYANIVSNCQGVAYRAFATTRNLALYVPNNTDLSKSITASITKDFSTGWLFGEILCCLVPIATNTIADRSYKNLAPSGTVTTQAVNTGCDKLSFTGSGNVTATLSKDVSSTGCSYWWEKISGAWTLQFNNLAGGQDYVNSVAGTVSTNVTVSGTTLTILSGVEVDRVRVSDGIMSLTQLKHLYETEKYNYVAGNQSLLAGTSNDCKSVAYDNFTGKHHIVTGDYYSEFKNLVRTNAIAGVWTSVAAQDDLVIKGA